MGTALPEVASPPSSPSTLPGLAKVAAAMASGGTFQGVKVLGEKGWEALHAKPTLGQLGFGSSDELYFTQVPKLMKYKRSRY